MIAWIQGDETAALEAATQVQMVGAACFGAVVGWYIYYVNRHRRTDVQLGDIVTVLGAIGGAAVLKLFPAQSSLFGAYGIGLAIGFFGYFFTLLVLVAKSDQFQWTWFLDGRRKDPDDGWGYPDASQPRPGGMGGGEDNPDAGGVRR